MKIISTILAVTDNSKAKRFFFIASIVVLLVSCAQIVSPTGGPKDNTPPTITKTIPNNFSTNFVNAPIKISFDEFVELVNPASKILISPPLKEQPTFKSSGKSISMHILDTLKPNTTYTLFFDNCIRDITEGNLIPMYEYVFSTSNAIDSGILRGKVYNATTLKPENEVYVMLYKTFNDTLPLTTKPYYITKTTLQGEFSFIHIAKGTYKIFALNDKNSNLLFDQFTEPIGFIDAPVVSNTNALISIPMFLQTDTVQKLFKKAVVERGKVLLTFKTDAKNTQFSLINKDFDRRFLKEFSANGDSVYLYDKAFLPDTVTILVKDRQMTDTIELSPSIERKTSRKIGVTKTRIGMTLSNERELYKTTSITFDSPLKSMDEAKIKLFKLGTDTVAIPFKLSATDAIHKKFDLEFKKVEQQTYLLTINDSALFGFNQLTNDTIRQSFAVLTENDYGNLLLHIANAENKPLIIQLLNDRQEVVMETPATQSTDLKWPNLNPGTYQVRAILDDNHNGKLDNGDYFRKTAPEKIYIFNTPIQIRAKWDIEEKFTID